MDRVELIIALTGDKDAVSTLSNLERTMNRLDGMKARLGLDKYQLDLDIQHVRKQLDELKSRRNQIRLNADEAKAVETRIKQLSLTLQALGHAKTAIKLDGGNVEDVNRLISKVKAELDSLNLRKLELKVASSDEIAQLDKQIADLEEKLTDLTRQKQDIRVGTEGLNGAIKGAEDLKAGFDDARQSAIDLVNAIGTLIQSLGGISGSIGNFASNIGNYFSTMADMFSGGNIFNQMRDTLTEMATQTLIGDFGKITSRYDIMSTFTDYMELAGVASDKAADALQRVNDSILGLPIGLDESAQRLRRYQMYLNDIEASTNLTIGLQKAIYAGGANEQMRNQTLYQIERLLTVGKLNTARQWNALIQGLGVSVRFLAEELGTEANNLPALLSSGAVSTSEFLQALQNLGEGSSEAAQKLDNALEIYKGTLESWISNIRFAAVRGGETILKALNQSLMANTGQGVVGYMRDLRDAMNEMYAGVGKFITTRPEALGAIVDSVERLLTAVGRFNASKIGDGILANVARGFDMISQALNRLPVEVVQDFIAFSTTLAGPLGALFKTVSAGLPILIGVFNRFKDFDFEGLLDKIITQVGVLATVVEKLLSIIPDGLMGDLMAFGLVWGKPAAATLKLLGEAIRNVAAGLALSSWKDGANFIQMLTKLTAMNLPIMATVGAVTALISALAIWEGHQRDLAESMRSDDIARTLKNSADIANESANLIAANTKQFEELNASLEVGQTLAQKILELNRTAKSSADFAQLSAMVEQLNGMFPGLNVELDEATGKLSASGIAALEAADGFMAYSVAVQKVEAALQAIKDYSAEAIKLDIDAKVIETKLLEAQALIEKLWTDWSPSYDFIKYMTPEGLYRWTEGAAGKSRIEWNSPPELDAAIDDFRELYEALRDNENAVKDNQDAMEAAWDVHKEAAEAAKEGADAYGEMAASVDNATDSLEAVSPAVAKARDEIKGLVEAYEELGEAATENIKKQIEGFGELELAKTVGIEQLIANLNSRRDALLDFQKNTAELVNFALKEQNFELAQLMAEMAKDPLGNAGYVRGLAEALEGGDTKKIYEAAKTFAANSKLAAKEGALAGFVESLGNEENFLAALGLTPQDNVSIEKIAGILSGTIVSAAEKASLKVKDGLRQGNARGLWDTLLELPDGGEGKGTAGGESKATQMMRKTLGEVDVDAIAEDLTKQSKAILDTSLTGMLDSLMNPENPMFSADTFKTMFDPMIKGIGEVGNQVSAVTEYVAEQTYAAGEGQIQQIDTITNDTLPALNSGISDTQTATEDMTTAVTTLGDEEDKTKQKTDDLKKAIIEMVSAMASRISVLGNFATAVGTVGMAAAEAAGMVERLAGAIASLQSKDITIGVNFAGSPQTMPIGVGGSVPIALPASTGGLITHNGVLYRAGGGGVFRPIGTDTVPAMLTPGEFVINRKAVNRLGMAFLDRINKLDIEGAYKALMYNYPKPDPFMPVYSTVNNQRYDNRNINYSPTFYGNTTDSASRMIASRWARGLR